MTAFSCEKNNDIKIESSLISEWGLIEILADPGDGSGTFQSVESDKIIEFHDNGTITSNGPICFMSINTTTPSSGTFSLIDSTITASECIADLKIKFEHNDDILIINYPCIEPCRAKFEKK